MGPDFADRVCALPLSEDSRERLAAQFFTVARTISNSFSNKNPSLREDLMSEALVGLTQAINALSDGEVTNNFRGYFYKCMRNRCLDFLKSKENRKTKPKIFSFDDPAHVDPDVLKLHEYTGLERNPFVLALSDRRPSVESIVVSNVTLEELITDAKLKDVARKIILLRAEGFESADVAEILGIPLVREKVTALRAREKIVKMLDSNQSSPKECSL